MSFSRRRLPHLQPDGKWLFVTWHRDGSLPPARFPPPGKNSDGKVFVAMDRYLDSARTGPRYLLKAEIAAIVAKSIKAGVLLGHYELRAWVIMPNHVHVLLLPLIPASRVLQSLKGATAREANKILQRTGRKFWHAESYDHWVRDDSERERIAAYIENNPVKAGLGNYDWSSAADTLKTKPSPETRYN